MGEFKSLTKCLEGLFDSQLACLPDNLRQRVIEISKFRPPWDSLSADQRRTLSVQSDFENDPACQEARERIFDLYCQIDETKKAQCVTSSDLDSRDRRIREREQEIKQLNADLMSKAFARWGLPMDMPTIHAVAQRIQPGRERALAAINRLYPEGVPSQADEPNAMLLKKVGAALKETGRSDISNDTILRAAGRRK